ncbi:MAG: glycosyltransferase family 2 protein [Anaerolineae bacterium]
MPLISVVLPTYNRAHWLPRAVETVLAQDTADWELIIVNDCSTDDTANVADRFAAQDSRIRVVHNPVNRKLPASLNIGFALATGAYFTWTSDDNLYRPQALRVLANALDAHADVGVVYSALTIIDADDRPIGKRPALPMHYMTFKNVAGASFMYRRDVHEALGGYDESLFLVEDYDFWLRASVHFKMLSLPDDLYMARMHDQNLTTSRKQEIILAREKLLLHHLPRLTWATRKDRMEAYALMALELREIAPERARRYQRIAWQLAPHVMARRALLRWVRRYTARTSFA